MGARQKGLIVFIFLAVVLGQVGACSDSPNPAAPPTEVSGNWTAEGDSASVEYKFDSNQWDHAPWVSEFGAKLIANWEFPYS